MAVAKGHAVSAREIQRLDKIAIENFGIPSLALMENAGRSVSVEVIHWLKKYKNPLVCIFCGRGNNAGDGFVAARYLDNVGIRTKVFFIGKEADLKSDAALHYRVLKKLKFPLRKINGVDKALLNDMAHARLFVDAIFGVGLNRKIADPFKSIIEALNAQRKQIISIDVPSGLDATTGKIYGVCVKASATVTFSLLKKGLLKNDGPRYAGRIIVADIGIPQKLFEAIQ